MRPTSFALPSSSIVRALIAFAAAAALLTVMMPASVAQPRPPVAGGLEIEVASGRADTITGGDALVRVVVPRNVPAHRVTIEVRTGSRSVDVTGAFEREAGSNTLLGVVDGLPEGESTIVARANGNGHGRPRAELDVTNHPSYGPVFSGPHQQPFYCNPSDSGLGPDHDEFCHVDEPVVEYFYRHAATGDFLPLTDPSVVPDDAARTTTTEGRDLPFIVRNERGTLNRGIYNIAVLHDPAEDEWGDPLQPQSQWNGRLYYQLEGACRPGFTQDRERAEDILARAGQDDVLGAGFAVARHTFTRHGNACGNDPLSAESMMMVREHFTVNYGEPLHMIGNGGSGGAILQYLTADNYPGILDGIIATSTFPDAYSIAIGAGDGPLVNRVFADSEVWPDYDWSVVAQFPGSWSPALEASLAPLTAVAGFGSWAINLTWLIGNTRNLDPRIYIGRYVPEEALYDPVTNPDGIRATIYEAGKNVWGTDPETGFARLAWDNAGVQYGLNALNDGVMSAEEFVTLNEEIGGYNIDGDYVPERNDIDAELAALAYQSGRIVNGGLGLTDVPMLNVGLYQDTVELGADYHDRFRDFSLRARLLRENGHFDNHVMWQAHPAAVPADFAELPRLLVMDEWVTSIGADTRSVPTAQKVQDNRPADLTDRCTLADGSHHTALQWPADDTGNPCLEQLPPAGDPRIAAGGPIAADVLKCQLQPIDFDSYPVEFTADQKDRLVATFPDGVCDWSKPGVGQQPPMDTWLSFATPGVPVPLSP
jgi:hypothetical protein